MDTERMSAWYHAEKARTYEDVADEFGLSVYQVRKHFRLAGVPGKTKGARVGKEHVNNTRSTERRPSRGHLDPHASIARASVRRWAR